MGEGAGIALQSLLRWPQTVFLEKEGKKKLLEGVDFFPRIFIFQLFEYTLWNFNNYIDFLLLQKTMVYLYEIQNNYFDEKK